MILLIIFQNINSDNETSENIYEFKSLWHMNEKIQQFHSFIG